MVVIDVALNDTDADGMDDGWEYLYMLDPLKNDAETDSDADGLTNLQEYSLEIQTIGKIGLVF